MYFIANAHQEIIAEAHSFSPTEPPRWRVGDTVVFEINRIFSAESEICLCELTGGLWFVLMDHVSVTVGTDSKSGTWVRGRVTEINRGDGKLILSAVKKYVEAFASIVKIDATLMNDLVATGNPQGGFSGVINRLLDEGKRVVITGIADGPNLEVTRQQGKLSTKPFQV